MRDPFSRQPARSADVRSCLCWSSRWRRSSHLWLYFARSSPHVRFAAAISAISSHGSAGNRDCACGRHTLETKSQDIRSEMHDRVLTSDRFVRHVKPFCLVEMKCYLSRNRKMRTAGVREARQNLTDLLDDVKKGREVLITDRGRPVARLAPIERRRPFPDLSRVRRAFRGPDPALSQAIMEEREDRL